jgi:hypothetical protein
MGLISSSPVNAAVNSLHELKSIAFVPLHLPFSTSSSSSVIIEQISNSSSSVLQKATNDIRNHFYDLTFNCDFLLLITYHKTQPASDLDEVYSSYPRPATVLQLNTVQVALAADNDGRTFVLFIYEELESGVDGVAGVVFPHGVYNLPTRTLADKSNVDSPGKWILRVDQSSIVTCPAGRRQPPFCDSCMSLNDLLMLLGFSLCRRSLGF